MKKYKLVLLCIFFAASCSKKLQTNVSKDFVHAGMGYSKAVAITSGNVKTIYVSGLTGDGTDFEAQTRSAFANIQSELAVSGATIKDVVKMNTYIVNCQPQYIDLFRKVRKEMMGEIEMPASTIVGVQTLAAKDKMIEIEAIAVIPLKNNKK